MNSMDFTSFLTKHIPFDTLASMQSLSFAEVSAFQDIPALQTM